MLTAFLWKRVDSIKNGIEVCWKEMRKPIKQGGLGLPDSTNWNKALLFKDIWHIALKSEGMADIVKWLPSKSGLFSVKSANEVLIHFAVEVYWHHLVWFKKYIRNIHLTCSCCVRTN